MSLEQERFGKAIIEGALRTLRDQKDQQQQLFLQGTITLNPQNFQHVDAVKALQKLARTPKDLWARVLGQDTKLNKSHLVVGPIYFNQRFQGLPKITYGQATPFAVDKSVQKAKAGASDYTPFLVMPHTIDVVMSNGIVEGFYCGLYALTSPPVGVSVHKVDWMAVGSASRYSDQAIEDTWSEAYDHNSPEFLHYDAEVEE